MSQIAPWLRELLRDPVDVSPLTDAEHMPPHSAASARAWLAPGSP